MISNTLLFEFFIVSIKTLGYILSTIGGIGLVFGILGLFMWLFDHGVWGKIILAIIVWLLLSLAIYTGGLIHA